MTTGLERGARTRNARTLVGRTGAALAFTAAALLSGCAQFPFPFPGTPAEATPTGPGVTPSAAASLPNPVESAPASVPPPVITGPVAAAPAPPPEPFTPPAAIPAPEPPTPPVPPSATPSATPSAPAIAPAPALGSAAPAVVPAFGTPAPAVTPAPAATVAPPPGLGIGAPPGIGVVPPTGPVAAPPPAADVPFVIAFHAGVYKCELGRSVHVREITTDRRTITLQWSRKDYTLAAVEARTGALRFEDAASGFVWIVIPAKAMLLDTRSGRQLANECRL